MKGVVFSWVLAALAPALSGAPFHFVAIGDMPYNLPGDYRKFENLIDEANRVKPAFTVHVGDIKSGSTVCSDEAILKIRDYFSTFEHPVILTPGDNEWTDCHRDRCGAYDPIERLDFLRRTFFSGSQSLGKRRMDLFSQGRSGSFSDFVENRRWIYEDIPFLTVHVVGSHNNHNPGIPRLHEEYLKRDRANRAWLDAGFQAAEAAGAPGMVVIMHANPFASDFGRPNYDPWFADLMGHFAAHVRRFERPVLLIHGDSHIFRIDKPMTDPATGKTLSNLTRLEVFGAPLVHGVKVIVDGSEEQVFSIEKMIVEENL